MSNRLHRSRLEQLEHQAEQAERAGKPVELSAAELALLVEEVRVLRLKNARARTKLRDIRGKLADVLASQVLGSQVDERSVTTTDEWGHARVVGGHTTVKLAKPELPFTEGK